MGFSLTGIIIGITYYLRIRLHLFSRTCIKKVFTKKGNFLKVQIVNGVGVLFVEIETFQL